MNKEKQKIAIAEACGWSNLQDSDYKPFGKAQLVGRHPGGSEQNLLRVPDYLNDLNAMHEAETCEAIQRVGYAKYIECLAIACGTERLGALVFATAAQRAEAFLRTIGKWKE
jgi:hypothetical protein